MKTIALPQIAEYGSETANNNLAIRTILATKFRAMLSGKPRIVDFYHQTAGYECAGSAMRYSPEVWGYVWNDGRSNHGMRCLDRMTAEMKFNAIS